MGILVGSSGCDTLRRGNGQVEFVPMAATAGERTATQTLIGNPLAKTKGSQALGTMYSECVFVMAGVMSPPREYKQAGHQRLRGRKMLKIASFSGGCSESFMPSPR
jgi:hypothetical protein